MNPTIKARIEKIKSGEVPEGYKRTKIGIVPNGWVYVRLGDYLIKYKEVSECNNQYPVLTSSRRGIFLQSEYYKQDVASEDNTGYNVVPRGYFTYRHMSDDNIFRFNINTIVDKGIVSTLYPVFTTRNICDTYLLSLLNNGREFSRFATLQKQGGSRTYVYFDKLQELRIWLPPIAEQQKIAEILATQDKVIELKEKLLKEKQRQKKYLMQQLLTKKKRLPGFSGEWRMVELGIIFDYIQPTNYIVKSDMYNSNYTMPVLTAGKSLILGYTNEQDGIFKDVPVVIFDDFTTSSQYIDFPFKVKSSAMKILKCRQNYNIVFAYHALKSVKYMIGGHERHWISKFANIPVKMPSLEEQTAIAQILSTADKEIELFKKDIEQEKLKKKSLMQLLLTGIVRVENDRVN